MNVEVTAKLREGVRDGAMSQVPHVTDCEHFARNLVVLRECNAASDIRA